MEKCYEFFKCEKTECIVHKNNNLNCWEVENTLCASHNNDLNLLHKLFESKKDYCKFCFYYQDCNADKNIIIDD